MSSDARGYLGLRPEEFEIEENGSLSSMMPGASRLSLPKVSSFMSLNLFKDGEVFLQNSARKCNGVLLEGPRRLLRLCLFGFLLPSFLITVPLYARLILYPPFHYAMAPTDQRLLEHTSSSLWCQGQTVHMNGSFNAFLLSGTPHTRRQYSTHTMLQHLVLEDDIKEYWGFFLQKGSIININLCNRYDGGMIMIMRGVNNLRKCAWIGEEDSAEQDEDHKDTSNESGQGEYPTHEFPMVNGELLMEVEGKESFYSRPGLRSVERVNMTSEERKEELDYYIKKVLKLGKSKKEVLQTLKKHRDELNSMKDPKLSLQDLNKKGKSKLRRNKNNQKLKQGINKPPLSSKMDKLDRLKRSLADSSEVRGEVGTLNPQQQSIREGVYFNVQNSSYEVSNATRDLYLSLFSLPNGLTYERGKLNQSTPHDTSNEEHRSSFSSSEEALTKCEGLIGIMPLYPSRKCHSFADSHTNKIKYKIPVTGTYYFVFSSDNEVFNSDIFLNMTLERVVYDTDAAKESCVNKTDCSLAFSFWSHDQAVVDVPEGDWNAAYQMELKCQPRVSVYLAFLFLIPIVILFCAFH